MDDLGAPGERPRAHGRTNEQPGKPLPLALELPGPKAAASVDAVVKGAPRSWPRVLAVALGGLLTLAALGAAAVEWALPWYVRRACIEVAAAHGIDLSVERAELDPGGFRLVAVRAALTAVPQAQAQAPEVAVQTSGLQPQKLTVRGAELTLRGPLAALEDGFARWRASPGGGQSGAWAPASLILDGGRLAWQAALGESVRVETADVHAQFLWHDAERAGPRLEMHARSDAVTVDLGGGKSLGPWRVDLDRTSTGAAGTRMRVALDPAVPDACTLLVVGDGEHTTSVDLDIPRSPLPRLGLPESTSGAPGKGLQIEASLHYTALGPARADLRAKGGLYGVESPALAHSMRPVDVNWEGTASGDPTGGIDVRNARLAVGPLVGALTGTFKKFEDGFRLDLAWAGGPVPCQAFLVPLGLGQPFDIGYMIANIAKAAPRGQASQVSAAIVLSFDSRDLGATKVDFTPEIRCEGLSLTSLFQ
jgi:hypothetical protein